MIFLIGMPIDLDAGYSGKIAERKQRAEVRAKESVDQFMRRFAGPKYTSSHAWESRGASKIVSYTIGSYSEIQRIKNQKFNRLNNVWISDISSLKSVGDAFHFSGTTPALKNISGSYSAAVLTRGIDGFVAWNTIPAIDAIHWARNDGWVWVSNRPILCALAKGNIEISQEFIHNYIATGYSITNASPFEGVNILDPESSILVLNGELQFSSNPSLSALALYEGIDEGSADEAHCGSRVIANALTNYVHAHRSPEPVQVRLSGGVDSRVMLGAYSKAQQSIFGVTFGSKTDPDSRLATEFAKRLNFSNIVTRPVFNDPSSLRNSVIMTLRRSGGSPLSEPHQVTYDAFGDLYPQASQTAFGQWPLYKGGLAKRMRYPNGELPAALGQVSRYAGSQAKEFVGGSIEKWWNRTPANTNLEKLYLFSRQFRSGRWMQANSSYYDGYTNLQYPIADAKITSVCDSLSMAAKVSGRLAFHTINELWHEGATIPLDKNSWSFVNARNFAPSEHSALTQTESLSNIPDAEVTVGDSRDSAEWGNSLTVMCKELYSSSEWSSISLIISEEINDLIIDIARNNTSYISGKSDDDIAVRRFVWRIYTLEVLISMDWL